MRLCALGDLLLDVVVRTSGSSGPDAEGSAETRVGAGGQAANVAAWAAELGAEARFVGKRGSDAAGELAGSELRERGVELLGPVEEGRNGVVVSLVSPDGSRTMLTDRGVAPGLRAEELDVRWFGGCDRLHLSGYSLLRRPIEEAAAKAAGAVQAQGGRVSIDLASASGIAEYGPEKLLGRLELLGPELVFANESELDAIGGDVPGTLVLKLGADGFRVDGARLPRAAGRRRGHDRSGRRTRGRLPRRRPGARRPGRCSLRRPAGSDAVIRVAPEITDALRSRAPVVALETTLVAHGFPEGEGLAVGLESARAVRDAGALPATVGVLDGALRIGLSDSELERFTADARKVGPRDLAAAVVQGAVGATTVGGTLAACRAAGIGFLGTGGIGGVHRGNRMDISADLGELARTEALVVSSGIKSLLDVPATMELLESLGIPVVGLQTDDLPLFYTAHGGPPLPAESRAPARRPSSRARTGASSATRRSCSSSRRRRASTTSSR